MAEFNGTNGDDIIAGTTSSDKIRGFGGNDQLSGSGGNDIIEGGFGADLIDGGDQNDILASYLLASYAGDPDRARGSFDIYLEQDTLLGGAGNDEISAGYGDIVDGGSGTNTLAINLLGASAGVTTDFTLLTNGGMITIGGGTIRNISSITGLDGSDFADTITVTTSGSFFANGGNDILTVGGTGSVDGGTGNDTITTFSGGGLTQVRGGDGDDVIDNSANGSTNTFGNDGNDTITTRYRALGGAGNDLIRAYSNNGNAWAMYGEAGDDELIGLDGSVNLSGGAGADILRGSAGADQLAAGDWDDDFHRGRADDGAEKDQLFGNGGNDRIWAGAGDDADGGADIDTLFLSLAGAGGGVSLNLADLFAGTPQTILGGTLRNFEEVATLRGTAFDDTVIAGTQAIRLTLDGGAGNDQLTGANSGIDFITGTGDDTVQGSSQGDTVEAAAGTKTVSGNGGNDTFILLTVQIGLPPSSYDGGAGTDTLDYSKAGQAVRFETSAASPGLVIAGGNNVTNVERFIGGGGDDVFAFGAYAAAVTVTGGAGNDSFTGGAGSDAFFGGDGNDTAAIGANDLVEMGNGNDTVSVSFVAGSGPTVTSLTGGAGFDLVRFRAGITGTLAQVQTTAGDATFALSGIEGIEVAVIGGVSSDVTGTTAQVGEYFRVDPFNDDGSTGVRFNGRGGGDQLIGGRGDDTLISGYGFNTLDGGGGTDVAVYAGLRSAYQITPEGGTGRTFVSDLRITSDTIANIEWLQFDDQLIYIGPAFQQSPTLAFGGFGFSVAAGGWSSDGLYPRTAADINGDGMVDLVGFGSNGVYVALATGDGAFGPMALAYASFGQAPEAGGWTTDDRYPRMLADVNGDGMADLIGFGSAGVYVALASGSGGFGSLALASQSFGLSAGGWTSQAIYPRTAADINGDGMADLVGFGSNGVYTALATGDGQFAAPTLSYPYFGQSQESGGWYTDDRTPRMLGDVNGDGMADLIGFGRAGVYVALATGGGNFGAAEFTLPAFGEDISAGGWTNNIIYPRTVADVNGDGLADLVGFGSAGVQVAFATGDGRFDLPEIEMHSFGYDPDAGGWISNDRFPRLLADVTGDGLADIIGFGDAGVYLARAAEAIMPGSELGI